MCEFEGLNETRMNMRKLRAGMNEGMNEAHDGMKALKEMVVHQTDNVYRLLEAMTRITMQVDLDKENSVSSSRMNASSEFVYGRPNGRPTIFQSPSEQRRSRLELVTTHDAGHQDDLVHKEYLRQSPGTYVARDVTKLTEHRVHRHNIIQLKVYNDLQLMMSEG